LLYYWKKINPGSGFAFIFETTVPDPHEMHGDPKPWAWGVSKEEVKYSARHKKRLDRFLANGIMAQSRFLGRPSEIPVIGWRLEV